MVEPVTVLLSSWQVTALDALATMLLLTTAIIAITRNIPLAIKTYIVQAGLLVAMFTVLGLKYEWFLGWALSAVITKMILVPWTLLWVVKRTRYVAEREEPLISIGLFMILIGIIYALSVGFARYVAEISHVLARLGITSLASAIALIAVGLSIVTLARNAMKQILGIILFENGAHVMLASMAFYVPETVEIGIATDAVVLVTILSILAHRMVKIRGDMDVSKLNVLRG